MNYSVTSEGGYSYIETKGGSENLILLHGLFGALSNYKSLLDYFGSKYNVVVPLLPIFDLPAKEVGVNRLMIFAHDFVVHKGYESIHLLGNSLGGHIGLLYVLEHPDLVKSITLTGSSGLFETSLGTTFPRRGNYEFVEKKVKETFYDPDVGTKEQVDEVFEVLKDRSKVLNIIATAKSAIRFNLANKLDQIKTPTLLIWGKNDNITPPFVGEQFHELILDSELRLIDKCGHVPMMEHPGRFNAIYEAFLEEIV